jgi:hypothetical protein
VIRAVDIVIPDAGPIISLAHADRLELIEIFACPIKVMDVVKHECLRKEESPDHERLARWFHRTGNRIEIVGTPLLSLYETALEEERSGRNPKATRGLGDASLLWALRNLDLFTNPGATPLILIEDRMLGTRLGSLNSGHVLSTRSWLAALEDAGHIASADDVIAEMDQHGRMLSHYAVDRPVIEGDERSDWLQSILPKRNDEES